MSDTTKTVAQLMHEAASGLFISEIAMTARMRFFLHDSQQLTKYFYNCVTKVIAESIRCSVYLQHNYSQTKN